MTVVVLCAVLAALSLVGFAVGVADDGFSDGDLAGVFGFVVFGALAWRLWAGARYAWVFMIVVASLMILAGVLNPTPVVGAVFAIGLGAGLILLLTVPASARAHFDIGRRRTA